MTLGLGLIGSNLNPAKAGTDYEPSLYLKGLDAIRDRYSVADAAVLAIVAGGDMALIPAGDVGATTRAITAAVADGRLTEARLTEAADRVLSARGGCTDAP